MWKAVASTALSLAVVVLFVFAGAIAWSARQWDEPGPLAQGICVEVPQGSTMRDLAEQLEARGALRSKFIFNTGVEYSRRSSDLKAGSFIVPEHASMADVLDVVTGSGRNTCGREIVWRIGVNSARGQVREVDPTTGSYSEIAAWDLADEEQSPLGEYLTDSDTELRLVVAEGVTSWQVREALNGIEVLEAGGEVIPPEGSLAPGSYVFTGGQTPEELIAKMQAEQQRRLANAWAARSDKAQVTSPEEALILASIIEKETALASERFEVASVFNNRLARGMRLQTDPTVIYGITKGQGILGRGLRRSELDRETPWNTYRIDGLPPTPIANPGLESIEAAVAPAETDYLYFVADGTGGHAFARTLKEHNANVARWRAIEAGQGGG